MQKFVELIQLRSNEHEVAFSRIHDLPGSMVAILRQELDSLIRVLYLLSIPDLDERKRLMLCTVNGEKWKRATAKGKLEVITDSKMVGAAEKFEGWARSVYKFGCSFIHLSNFHGYLSSNPFESISPEEKNNILTHMRHYHGGPHSDNPSFNELAARFPAVFEKIQGNLECYLEDLNGEVATENVL